MQQCPWLDIAVQTTHVLSIQHLLAIHAMDWSVHPVRMLQEPTSYKRICSGLYLAIRFVSFVK
jgi:hypothetical protein